MKTSIITFIISLLLAVIIDGAAYCVHQHYCISTSGVRAAFLAFLIPIILISFITIIYKLYKKGL